MKTCFISLLKFRVYRHIYVKTMSTFVSKVNRITGKMDWVFRDDDYDYKQEIARSSYADMLHDTERNHLYYEGLKVAIAKKREQGEPVHVLDIGTGTGLLSMMAARLGADTVHACEAFAPMAECAKKIIADNGFADKITIIPKRSTELIIGTDMPVRANILVTEVFDTELIGEGAIGTFTHALRELLQKDSIVIPSFSNLYVQLVSSDLVRKWNRLDDFVVNNGARVTAPDNISSCGGAPSLHDLQLDQLPMDQFTVLTEPIKVFRFDFTGRTPLPFNNTSVVETNMLASGTVDAVFMWWDLEMDPDSNIILSCAPRWAHPTPHDMQWRDHWMQAIYYPYTQQSVSQGEKLNLISKHDEYSLWFDVSKNNNSKEIQDDRPICRCGAHITYSRSRLGMLSDPVRRNTYMNVLKKHITQETTVLFIGDGSLLPLLAAKLGAKHVYTIESNLLCCRVVRDFIKHNNLQERVTIIEKLCADIQEEDIHHKIDLVIGEPMFQTAVLPWDNMAYWYSSHHMAPHARYLPGKMSVYAVAVQYEHLWKIRADVGMCEGFNIQQFDQIIQLSSDTVDENIEPQPLWEYPCTASGPATSLFTLDFTKSIDQTPDLNTTAKLDVISTEPANGVALWAEFDFGNGHVISCGGPREPIRTGEKILWDYYTRQGVHLLYNNKKDRKCVEGCNIDVNVKFVPEQGDLSFTFHPNWLGY